MLQSAYRSSLPEPLAGVSHTSNRSVDFARSTHTLSTVRTKPFIPPGDPGEFVAATLYLGIPPAADLRNKAHLEQGAGAQHALKALFSLTIRNAVLCLRLKFHR